MGRKEIENLKELNESIVKSIDTYMKITKLNESKVNSNSDNVDEKLSKKIELDTKGLEYLEGMSKIVQSFQELEEESLLYNQEFQFYSLDKSTRRKVAKRLYDGLVYESENKENSDITQNLEFADYLPLIYKDTLKNKVVDSIKKYTWMQNNNILHLSSLIAQNEEYRTWVTDTLNPWIDNHKYILDKESSYFSKGILFRVKEEQHSSDTGEKLSPEYFIASPGKGNKASSNDITEINETTKFLNEAIEKYINDENNKDKQIFDLLPKSLILQVFGNQKQNFVEALSSIYVSQNAEVIADKLIKDAKSLQNTENYKNLQDTENNISQLEKDIKELKSKIILNIVDQVISNNGTTSFNALSKNDKKLIIEAINDVVEKGNFEDLNKSDVIATIGDVSKALKEKLEKNTVQLENKNISNMLGRFGFDNVSKKEQKVLNSHAEQYVKIIQETVDYQTLTVKYNLLSQNKTSLEGQKELNANDRLDQVKHSIYELYTNEIARITHKDYNLSLKYNQAVGTQGTYNTLKTYLHYEGSDKNKEFWTGALKDARLAVYDFENKVYDGKPYESAGDLKNFDADKMKTATMKYIDDAAILTFGNDQEVTDTLKYAKDAAEYIGNTIKNNQIPENAVNYTTLGEVKKLADDSVVEVYVYNGDYAYEIRTSEQEKLRKRIEDEVKADILNDGFIKADIIADEVEYYKRAFTKSLKEIEADKKGFVVRENLDGNYEIKVNIKASEKDEYINPKVEAYESEKGANPKNLNDPEIKDINENNYEIEHDTPNPPKGQYKTMLRLVSKAEYESKYSDNIDYMYLPVNIEGDNYLCIQFEKEAVNNFNNILNKDILPVSKKYYEISQGKDESSRGKSEVECKVIADKYLEENKANISLYNNIVNEQVEKAYKMEADHANTNDVAANNAQVIENMIINTLESRIANITGPARKEPKSVNDDELGEYLKNNMFVNFAMAAEKELGVLFHKEATGDLDSSKFKINPDIKTRVNGLTPEKKKEFTTKMLQHLAMEKAEIVRQLQLQKQLELDKPKGEQPLPRLDEDVKHASSWKYIPFEVPGDYATKDSKRAAIAAAYKKFEALQKSLAKAPAVQPIVPHMGGAKVEGPTGKPNNPNNPPNPNGAGNPDKRQELMERANKHVVCIYGDKFKELTKDMDDDKLEKVVNILEKVDAFEGSKENIEKMHSEIDSSGIEKSNFMNILLTCNAKSSKLVDINNANEYEKEALQQLGDQWYLLQMYNLLKSVKDATQEDVEYAKYIVDPRSRGLKDYSTLVRESAKEHTK